MAHVEEKIKPGGLVSGARSGNLFEGIKLLKEMQDHAGAKKQINSELWHACAGPLVTLPQVGSLVYYFPQGHSEQVAVSTNRMATAQIPSYRNLPSELLCQVHNITLHADKDTDEIYSQMSLQPVNSERDVIPIPDLGLKTSKHPTEFFCKILTASDTSTHGGFSVPRRAAEKLFPQLDYSMQPPTQELVVRDLHDNTWRFRHIYRGQPKRHLLTTGWSMFVGAKRLKAGDSVLFMRDAKSQLLVGVRQVNRQQATLPSSVLSADSMHIGILAAAAHAAATRIPFTIFYNPRACPSQFVIPFLKYRKAVHGSQLSIGMRFGMMFETEESSKRRYMGTITGISDLDPLRWPNSKWRSLQVEWDEPGCGDLDKQNRVSPWEIETPERLFIFPSLPANPKRPFHAAFLGAQSECDNLINGGTLRRVPGSIPNDLQCPPILNKWLDQLMKLLMRPHGLISPGGVQEVTGGVPPEVQSPIQSAVKQQTDVISPVPLVQSYQTTNTSLLTPETSLLPHRLGNGLAASELTTFEQAHAVDQAGKSQIQGHGEEVKLSSKPINPQNLVSDIVITDQNSGCLPLQANPRIADSRMDSHITQTQQIDASSQVDSAGANTMVQFLEQVEYSSYPLTCSTPSGSFRNAGSLSMIKKFDKPIDACSPLLASVSHELWDSNFNNAKCVPQTNLTTVLSHQDIFNLQYSSCGFHDLAYEKHNQSNDMYSCLENSGSTVIDPSVSSVILDDFCTVNDVDFPHPSNYLAGNFCSNQDLQSQITSASLPETRTFSIQEYADNSGGTSSSNVDFEDNNILQHSSWKQVTTQFRTYTKIQKAGSVGRSIDVSTFKNYDELRGEIEDMFGFEGLLNDLSSGWKLVYVDFENDVLLVGDDPWEEFVGCVRCIRILSPLEVEQMGEEGMQLLNSVGVQGVNGSASS